MQLAAMNKDTAWPVRSAAQAPVAPPEVHTEDAGPPPALFDRVRGAVLAQFSQTSFHKVGMRDVAREARTGMAALYEIASTKERLVAACLEPDFAARAERLEAASRREVGTRARLRACLAELIHFELERPDFARIVRLNAPPRLIMHMAGAYRLDPIIAEILRRGARDGSLRTDLDADAMAAMVCAQVEGALARWVQEDCDARPLQLEMLAEARVKLIWSMIWPAVSSD